MMRVHLCSLWLTIPTSKSGLGPCFSGQFRAICIIYAFLHYGGPSVSYYLDFFYPSTACKLIGVNILRRMEVLTRIGKRSSYLQHETSQ
jgi:hypothetical protein